MIGQILHDRYQISALLGKGAMGEVYCAADTRTGLTVAVKVITQKQAFEAEMVERFKREGEALRQLRHANIVGFVETFLHSQQHVIVMEYVAGGSLHQLIRQGGALPVGQAVRIGLELSDALVHTHQVSIIHRDIKPENVLLAKDGMPKLTDFGVARLVGGTARLTGTGMQVGTPYYMSPEAWEGKPLGPQADIWSLGVVLYEMLAGRVPFSGETLVTVMNKVLTAPLPTLLTLRPETPPALAEVVQRMLTRDPAQRYQTMRQVAADLEIVEEELKLPSAVGGKRREKVRWMEVAGKRPGMGWGLALGGILGIGGLLAVLGFGLTGLRDRAPARQLPGFTPSWTQPLAPTATPVPLTATLRPSQTSLPPTRLPTRRPLTATPVPTFTPRPELPLGAGSPMPGRADAIGPQNVDGLKELARWENGTSAISLAFNPDGQLLASGGEDGLVRLQNTTTGQIILSLKGHADLVNSLAFRPDGKVLASGSSDKTVRVWDTSTGQLLYTLTGHTYHVASVAFSPDGNTLASAAYFPDEAVRLWDLASGQFRLTLTGDSSGVNDLAFSPDGKTLASAGGPGNDNTVQFWNPVNGQLLRILTSHTSNVDSLAFSPDGKMLASGSFDQTVRLWEVATGKRIRTFRDHTDVVTCVAFSPDGKVLASGTRDNLVWLWDTTTGRLLRTLTGHTGGINRLAFSPDGKLLASAAGDGTVRLWGLVK